MSLPSAKELQAMPHDELRRDIKSQRSVVRKMRMQITMNTEKDSARYRREKRQLTRMLMVLGAALPQKAAAPTIAAPTKAPAAKKKTSSKRS